MKSVVNKPFTMLQQAWKAVTGVHYITVNNTNLFDHSLNVLLPLVETPIKDHLCWFQGVKLFFFSHLLPSWIKISIIQYTIHMIFTVRKTVRMYSTCMVKECSLKKVDTSYMHYMHTHFAWTIHKYIKLCKSMVKSLHVQVGTLKICM